MTNPATIEVAVTLTKRPSAGFPAAIPPRNTGLTDAAYKEKEYVLRLEKGAFKVENRTTYGHHPTYPIPATLGQGSVSNATRMEFHASSKGMQVLGACGLLQRGNQEVELIHVYPFFCTAEEQRRHSFRNLIEVITLRLSVRSSNDRERTRGSAPASSPNHSRKSRSTTTHGWQELAWGTFKMPSSAKSSHTTRNVS